MKHDHPSPAAGRHPEEALAAYVSGSAGAEERALVERHLGECDHCRADVAFAQAAVGALAAVPEVEAPGLAARLPEMLPDADSQPGKGPWEVISGRWQERAERRRARWRRAGWAAGLAAAAALVTVVALNVHLGGPSPSNHPPGLAASAGGRGAVVSRGADYDPKSLAALASSIASGQSPQAQGDEGRSSLQFGQLPAAPVPSPGQDPATCVRAAAGLPQRDQLVYLERARFKGTPVYVGGFLTNEAGSPYVLVVAADQTTCQPLQAISQRSQR